eukprot:gene4230-3021_t
MRGSGFSKALLKTVTKPTVKAAVKERHIMDASPTMQPGHMRAELPTLSLNRIPEEPDDTDKAGGQGEAGTTNAGHVAAALGLRQPDQHGHERLPATSITGLDGMSSTRLACGIAPHAGAGRRSRDLVARLVRWSFSPATDALGLLTGITASVETRFAARRGRGGHLGPDRALASWVYVAAADPVRITSASAGLPATTAASLDVGVVSVECLGASSLTCAHMTARAV